MAAQLEVDKHLVPKARQNYTLMAEVDRHLELVDRQLVEVVGDIEQEEVESLREEERSNPSWGSVDMVDFEPFYDYKVRE